MRLVFAGVVVCLLSATLSAQWVPFVRTDVPRAADGKPDLSAPPPRLANGRPDFSGVWESRVPPSGRPGPALPSIGEGPPVATFFNIMANMKEGLPFTPWAAELRKQRMASASKDNPDAHCLPIGFMQLHTHSQPRKMVHTKDDLVIMYEANYGLRQIFTDGRPMPANDPQPWWFGYSVGKWDGDTLVVETTNLNGKTWGNEVGDVFSHAEHVIERFKPVNADTIEYQATITDPIVYTRPFTIAMPLKRLKSELIEAACHEEDHDLPVLKRIRDQERAKRAGAQTPGK
jgi:hypothetical protein